MNARSGSRARPVPIRGRILSAARYLARPNSDRCGSYRGNPNRRNRGRENRDINIRFGGICDLAAQETIFAEVTTESREKKEIDKQGKFEET